MTQLTPHQIKALDYQKHISLTANAGSGKTFILSKRFVEIAVNENLLLNNIVAITFTDKAAGELNKKIANEIETRLNSETEKSKIKILTRLRRELVSANISTIHSFCVNILREFSPEAGLDARFTPIDQTTADELIDLTIEESLNSIIRDESINEKLKYLVRFFGSKNIFSAQLRQFLKNRRNILKVSKEIYTREEKEIAGHFNKQFRDGIKEIFNDQIYITIKNIELLNSTSLSESKDKSIASEVSSLIDKIKNSDDIIEIFALLNKVGENVLTTKGTVRQRGYLSKDTIDSLSEKVFEVENFFQSIKSIEIVDEYEKAEHELARFGKTFVEIFLIVHNKYAEKKKQKGYLDFEDILLFTQKLIKNVDVKEYLGNRYRFIMIDEYQDTNEVQYNIFMPILDYLRSGNLFIVGDEKQSIYMFRDAELEIFSRTKDEIVKGADNSSLLELPHSFRLAPAVAAFTNKLFENLFSNPDLRFNEVAYNELICAKDETGGIEIIIGDDATPENYERELVAKRIANLLAEKENEGIKLGDVAILCRKRSAFAELEQSFTKYNIPFSIVGGKGFYQRQVIYDIYNYLSFLLNPNNDIALVGLLRSPFFTLSDVEIFQISFEAGDYFYKKLKKHAAKNNQYNNVADILDNHLAMAGKSDITELVRRILSDTGYIAVMSSRANAQQELANIEKLIGISGSFSLQSFRTLFDFVNYLAEAIETLDDEAQASLAVTEDAVKIMTLHQAKGLEFKAVFLFKCHEYSREDKVKSKSISIEKNIGVLTKVPVRGNYFEEYVTPPIVGLYNYVIKRKQISEIQRLLYVGVTRAANYLFISATLKDDNLPNDSFIKFVVEGLNIDLQQPAFELESKLKFMLTSGSGFETAERTVRQNILITREIKHINELKTKNKIVEEIEKTIMIRPIPDLPKREIVSATKVAVFMQCPVKYQLIYELGYSRVYRMIKKYRNNYDFKYKEDEETKFLGDVKGRIVHAVLESEKDKTNIAQKVANLLDEEINLNNISNDDYDEMHQTICDDLNAFFDSEIFNSINSFEDAKNEFEIYTAENDFYLYGIIDKIIIDNGKAVIIDYKTDGIEEAEIASKAEGYLPQLKFYSYIISKLYKDITTFELWLVFIKHADKVFKQIVTKKDILAFGNSVNDIVLNIRNNIYKPNIKHCRNCHFYLDNKKCIKEYK